MRGQRVVLHKVPGKRCLTWRKKNKVLTVNAYVEPRKQCFDEIAFHESDQEFETYRDIQRSFLIHFQVPMDHLNYDTIEKLAKDPGFDIDHTDTKRQNCLTRAQGKQTKNMQSKNDICQHSPIDRIGGVICSDLKGPVSPRNRIGNRNVINFIDHKTIIFVFS